MNCILKGEENFDTRSRRGEGCSTQMKQHEQRHAMTWLSERGKWFSTDSENVYGKGSEDEASEAGV